MRAARERLPEQADARGAEVARDEQTAVRRSRRRVAAVLPPGAAHASSTRLPGGGAANAADELRGFVLREELPVPAIGVANGLPGFDDQAVRREAGTAGSDAWRSSARGQRVARGRASVFARSVTGAGALLKRTHASARVEAEPREPAARRATPGATT